MSKQQNISNRVNQAIASGAKGLNRLLNPDLSRLSNGSKVTMLGTRRSGKSALETIFHIVLVSVANQKHIRYLAHEYVNSPSKNARILGQSQSANEMRNGRFPEPTVPGTTFEADLEIIWPKQGLFGSEKTVEIPVVDIAGEDIAEMIKELSYGTYDLPQQLTVGSQLHDRILNADGFILVIDAARIIIDGKCIEAEVGDDISDFPDTNLKHILERVYYYKKEHEGNPIRAIAVILTQYDKVSGLLNLPQVCPPKGINLLTEDGRHQFMSMFFPETYDMLHFIGLDKVKIIPSWILTVIDPVTKKEIQHPKPFRDGSTSPLIKIKTGSRMENGKLIGYSEPDCNRDGILELIDWVKEYFAV